MARFSIVVLCLALVLCAGMEQHQTRDENLKNNLQSAKNAAKDGHRAPPPPPTGGAKEPFKEAKKQDKKQNAAGGPPPPHACRLTATACKKGVIHATDLEGDLKYMEAIKARMQKNDACDAACETLAEGWCFVAGGDSGDKGKGSLRVIKWLVDLKDAAPERVCLIIGNRDGNKIRFGSELVEFKDTSKTLVPGDKFRQWKGAKTMKEAAPKCGPANCSLTDKFDRLKYLLAGTMGSGGDEGRRKVELEELAALPAWSTYLEALATACVGEKGCSKKTPGCNCMVYESFRLGGTKGSPLALYIEYMQRAQVLAYLPSSKAVEKKGGVFFVHGTVEAEHLWVVPPVTYPTTSTKLEMKDPYVDMHRKGVDQMKKWEEAYWAWSQSVMGTLDGKDDKGGCTDEEWFADGCSKRGGFMHVEMGMPVHDKAVRAFETMTYGRSRTAPPAFWKAGGGKVEGNVLKDLCPAFNKGDGSIVVAIVVGHTPSGIVPDYLVSTNNKCLTYNGDTSAQGGPGGGEAKHHGCDENGAVCAGESHLVIKPAADGAFTFNIDGHVKAANGNFGKHLTDKEFKNKALEHKTSINTATLALSDGTAERRKADCVEAETKRLTTFGEQKGGDPYSKGGDHIIPEDEKNDVEMQMHKRAALTLNGKPSGALCASARTYGFDYDVVQKTAKKVAGPPRFRSSLRASASVAAAAPSSSINDEWAALYGGSAGAEGFPGDGITS